MGSKSSEVFLLIVFFSSFISCNGVIDNHVPKVIVSCLLNNKAHTLPYFLSSLNRLEYPKHAIDIWIRIESNMGDIERIYNEWYYRNKHLYNSVKSYTNLSFLTNWNSDSSKETCANDYSGCLIALREHALNRARRLSADFIFMLDGDVFLTEPDVLKILISRSYLISAPLLVSDTTHSNFWLGKTGELVTDEDKVTYARLIKRDRKYIGCNNLSALHSAVLISLKNALSQYITYDPKKIEGYAGPTTDVAVFAESARRHDVKLKLCNDIFYGFVVPPADASTGVDDMQMFINLKVDAIRRHEPLPVEPYLERYLSYPKPSTLSCDKIFMINLDRRSDRKQLMEMSFKELGMDVTRIPAVDGLQLNSSTLKALDIHLLDKYQDPYHQRPMKTGEIGCFMSHYTVWKQIVRKRYNFTMVLEDDVHFASNFRHDFQRVMDEVKGLDFDLLYLGRKILMEEMEEYVTPHTTRPKYSYWTLGYVLTYNGAKKLLDAKPLANLLPVDEFLPILFDQHPNMSWKMMFPSRDLVALSASPLLIYPTHYVGMPGYVSDTERSYILDIKNQRVNTKTDDFPEF